MSSPGNGGPPDSAPMVSPLGVVASCAAFVVLGTLQSLYGPSLPAFRSDFGISLTLAGLALGSHFLGGITGVLVYARKRGTASTPVKLSAALLVMGAGSAGFALAPDWPLALVGAFVGGLGFGGIDYGLNDLFARAFDRRRTAMLNILNAHFGIGAIAGPFLVSLLGPSRYASIFLGLAAVCVVLVAGMRGVHADPHHVMSVRSSDAVRLSSLLVAFIVFYVLNVGVEASIGGWEPTHLVALGHTAKVAASATSVYWLMLTVGRFLVVPLTGRWSDRQIVIGACTGIAACLALATVHGIAVEAYAGAGLFIAPIFPTALPWLHRVVPGARRAGAYVFAASMIGGVALPPLVGVAIAARGTAAIPVLLFAFNALCLAMLWWIVRRERHPSFEPNWEPAGS